MRLALGIIPREAVWCYNATMAAGPKAYAERMFNMFVDDPSVETTALRAVVQALLECKSITEAQRELSNRERRIASA